jgi:hypothetical protein
MSFIKVSSSTESRKCIRFDTLYTRCDIQASNIDKLQHILGLYDTIDTLTLKIDTPVENWKITRPLDTIKHLCLDAQTKFCNRAGVVPDNFWLMFPNLETIKLRTVIVPVDNLDTLTYLNTFALNWDTPKIKKTDNKIQEVIQILANMTTLVNLEIISTKECHIPDELFLNNPQLKYVKFARGVICDNIPSILNCRELVRLGLKINIHTNPYILELANMEEFLIIDAAVATAIPDEIFAKPIFTTCRTSNAKFRYGVECPNWQECVSSVNYRKWRDEKRTKGRIPQLRFANDNFTFNDFEI